MCLLNRCGDRELIENVQAFAFNHFFNVDVNAYNADFWGIQVDFSSYMFMVNVCVNTGYVY